MTESQFLEIARVASKRAVACLRNGHIGYLVATQKDGPNKSEPTLREPEICTVFQQTAEFYGLRYGVEVPTRGNYNFSGETDSSRNALTDFALLDSTAANLDRSVLIEFKRGTPDSDKIEKDLLKLLSEPALHGSCMFHFCHGFDEDTKKTLTTRYSSVMLRAQAAAPNTVIPSIYPARAGSVWFMLLLLALYPRKNSQTACLYLANWDGSKFAFQEDTLFS